MHTALAILLKSKKPFPVPVMAQTIAKMAMRTKATLITFKMTLFFMQSHSFIKFRFVWLLHYLYRRKSRQIVPTSLYHTIFLCCFQGMFCGFMTSESEYFEMSVIACSLSKISSVMRFGTDEHFHRVTVPGENTDLS